MHLVFVTKYRRQVFDAAHLRHLETVFGEVCDDFEAELVEFNGETDHVHLHINYPPTVAVSNLVNSLKGVSARIMRRDHPDLAPAPGVAIYGPRPTSQAPSEVPR